MFFYIYLIVNKVNGKTYVGQRKSLKQCYLDSYMGSGKHLKAAKAKYGIENFEKFLIQYCYSKEETDKAERFWIAEYRRRGKAEYNIADGGQGYSNKGRHCSEEHRKKISESLKGKPSGNKGKHISEEARKKISESNKGKHRSEESRKKISESMKGDKNPFYEKHHSEESRKKMSESLKGFHKGMHWKLVDGKRVWY